VNDALASAAVCKNITSWPSWTTIVTIESTSLTEDCDYTFVFFYWSTSVSQATVKWRVYDSTIARYSNTIIHFNPPAGSRYFGLLFLPWNVRNHNLELQVYIDTTETRVCVMGWSWAGAAPHTHVIANDTHDHAQTPLGHTH